MCLKRNVSGSCSTDESLVWVAKALLLLHLCALLSWLPGLTPVLIKPHALALFLSETSFRIQMIWVCKVCPLEVG